MSYMCSMHQTDLFSKISWCQSILIVSPFLFYPIILMSYVARLLQCYVAKNNHQSRINNFMGLQITF